MFQTEYKPLATIARNTSFIGGICKWWYTPVENILAWPKIDPLTQYLIAKPTLITGAQWYGPVKATKGKLSFDETPKRTLAGIFYQQRLEGIAPGDDRINMQNMDQHKYVALAVTRTGDYWLMIGTQNSPLTFDHSFYTGNGWMDTASNKIAMFTESKNKANIIAFPGAGEEFDGGEFDGGEFA